MPTWRYKKAAPWYASARPFSAIARPDRIPGHRLFVQATLVETGVFPIYLSEARTDRLAEGLLGREPSGERQDARLASGQCRGELFGVEKAVVEPRHVPPVPDALHVHHVNADTKHHADPLARRYREGHRHLLRRPVDDRHVLGNLFSRICWTR